MQSISKRRGALSHLGRWCYALALTASLTLNVILLKQVIVYRSSMMLGRLDPIGLSLYPPTIDRPEFKRLQSKKLVLFGDSRAARWPVPSGLPEWDFINRGAEAQTTAQALLRFDYHVSALHPNVVLIQVGVNDLRTIPLLPSQEHSVIENCERNISTIVEHARATGATVIMTTIFPLGDVPIWNKIFWPSRVAQAIDEVNKHIRSLSTDGVTIFDANALLAGAGSIQSLYKDGLHLNDQGYQILNSHFVDILAALP